MLKMVLFLLLLSGPGIVYAQTPGDMDDSDPAACSRWLQPPVRPFFYKIERDGKSVVILGTRHFGVSLKSMPTYVHEALDSATLVIEEVTRRPLWVEKIRDFMAKHSLFRFRGPKLGETLSPTAFAYLRTRFLKLGTPIELLEELTPALAAIFMDIRISELKEGRLDTEIAERAKQNGVNLRGLESRALQNRLIDDFASAESLEAEIQKRIQKQKNTSGDEPLSSLSDFKSGSIQAIEDSIDEMRTNTPDFYKPAIVDRNRRWIPKIKALIAGNERVFIAVGAAHLFGPDGLIPLLKKEGYRVERIETGD